MICVLQEVEIVLYTRTCRPRYVIVLYTLLVAPFEYCCKSMWAARSSQGTGLGTRLSTLACVKSMGFKLLVVASKCSLSSRTSIAMPPVPRPSTLGSVAGDELGLGFAPGQSRNLPSLTLAARLLKAL